MDLFSNFASLRNAEAFRREWRRKVERMYQQRDKHIDIIDVITIVVGKLACKAAEVIARVEKEEQIKFPEPYAIVASKAITSFPNCNELRKASFRR